MTDPSHFPQSNWSFALDFHRCGRLCCSSSYWPSTPFEGRPSIAA